MNFIFPILALHFWYHCSCTVNAQSAANFVIEQFHMCDIPNQIVNATVIIKNFVPERQIMDIHSSTPIPVGNQLRFTALFEMEIPLAVKHHWQHLFNIEDDFCRVLQVYAGEMVYDLETAMGIPRGSCPILQGRYHAVNFTPDFSRLKLQTFPFGRMRATINLLEKPKRNVALCLVIIISNKA